MIKVDISFGEFLDKLTILEIKSERVADAQKLANINKELHLLRNIWAQSDKRDTDISEEIRRLKAVNEKLWDVEDAIREKEHKSEHDEEFIQLARSVYLSNDERAAIKRELNLKLDSGLIEEKCYSDYQGT